MTSPVSISWIVQAFWKASLLVGVVLLDVLVADPDVLEQQDHGADEMASVPQTP